MSVTIEQDLKEILTKLDSKLDTAVGRLEQKMDTAVERLEQKMDTAVERLEQKIDNVGKDVTDLKVSVARLDESQKGLSTQITELSSKVNNLEGRVNVQVNWFLGIITVLVGGVVTALSKFVFFPSSNP
jgi:outer membrane murein-binding lipoprotein Lpp